MDRLLVAKVGGGIIGDEELMEKFLEEFAAIDSRKILVHGGGRIATEMAGALDIPVTLVDGRRITDEQMLDVVTMTYAGLVNKRVVSALQGLNCNAIGLCGADADLIRAERRPAEEIDYGHVGDITSVNTGKLEALLQQELIPVIASLTHDGKGHLLNTNADTIAATIAESLIPSYRVRLIFCFEEEGVLTLEEDEVALIEQLSVSGFREMKGSGAIHSGMVPKLENGFKALNAGAERVTLCHPKDLAAAFQSENGDTTGTHLINGTDQL